MMRKSKVWLSWSSGKDSAWCLYQLQQRRDIELAGLFCSINAKNARVAMHGVCIELLKRQAQAVGLPLYLIELPHPCSNEDYAAKMSTFVDIARAEGVAQFAFGDLYLEDVRRYRQQQLAETGIEAIFPLWGLNTQQLAQKMVVQGLRARISCIDSRKLPSSWVGREFDGDFLAALPDGVDPCGELGEFHSFAYAGPMFQKTIPIESGEVVTREGLVFVDLMAVESLD